MTGAITAGDLTELECALLFMHKKPQEVSVNPWNGMYYKLTPAGGRFEGTLHEVDMNPLIMAPFDTKERLIGSSDLHPAHPSSHRFPTLVIE